MKKVLHSFKKNFFLQYFFIASSFMAAEHTSQQFRFTIWLKISNWSIRLGARPMPHGTCGAWRVRIKKGIVCHLQIFHSKSEFHVICCRCCC